MIITPEICNYDTMHPREKQLVNEKKVCYSIDND